MHNTMDMNALSREWIHRIPSSIISSRTYISIRLLLPLYQPVDLLGSQNSPRGHRKPLLFHLCWSRRTTPMETGGDRIGPNVEHKQVSDHMICIQSGFHSTCCRTVDRSSRHSTSKHCPYSNGTCTWTPRPVCTSCVVENPYESMSAIPCCHWATEKLFSVGCHSNAIHPVLPCKCLC